MDNALERNAAVAAYGEPRHEEAMVPASAFSSSGNSRKIGEVAMILQKSDGEVWLQTKEFYPDGTFRIPTGGIKEGESIKEALWRELKEETDLEVEEPRFMAEIHYMVDGQPSPFVTYAFHFKVVGGDVKPDAEEKITGWKSVASEQLNEIAWELNSVPEGWAGWGWFRSVLHRVVHDALNGTQA